MSRSMLPTPLIFNDTGILFCSLFPFAVLEKKTPKQQQKTPKNQPNNNKSLHTKELENPHSKIQFNTSHFMNKGSITICFPVDLHLLSIGAHTKGGQFSSRPLISPLLGERLAVTCRDVCIN